MERRFSPIQYAPVRVEKRAEGEPPKIVGYGSVTWDGTERTEYLLWDDARERAVERIMPGAFVRALAEKDDVRGLFNHDSSLILGRTASGTMTLSLDGVGLKYEIEPGDTTVARDVQAHLKRGDVSGSSFAFTPDEMRWIDTKDDKGKWHSVREILSVTLYDVGPVTFPAYEMTTAGVRMGDAVEVAKRSLTAHRQQRTNDRALADRLAAIRARARIVA